MKLNWGLGIGIFYGSFMAVLLFFVIKTTTHDNSLVMDNYYEEDLNYEAHYQKVQNANDLEIAVQTDYDADQQIISILFSEDINLISGQVMLYRPDHKNEDLKQEIVLNKKGEMTIATADLRRGKWTLKLDWEVEGKGFYHETELFL